jgi:ribosomal protein L37AE/L43A
MTKPKGRMHYDKFGPQALEKLRSNNFVDAHWTRYGKLFCESCRQNKPKTKEPARKGWKCADCSAK